MRSGINTRPNGKALPSHFNITVSRLTTLKADGLRGTSVFSTVPPPTDQSFQASVGSLCAYG